MVALCEKCDRSFNTKKALQQHLRTSPAHAVTFDCNECDRAFHSEEALQQHLRDSPAHAIRFDCDECDRTFNSEEALQQHLRDSPAHSPGDDTATIIDSFDMRPSLHADVAHSLRHHGLHFDFHGIDDLHDVLKEHDTSVMGKFNCNNRSCASKSWTSKRIAITIREYSGKRYNARIYYQRCRSCDSLSRPELDESYAERISYRLAKWSGIAVEKPPHSGYSRKPHEIRLCEGCRLGHCWQSRL